MEQSMAIQKNPDMDNDAVDDDFNEEEQEALTEARAKREIMLAALASEMNKSLGTAIADKTPIETRMLHDEAQYWGAVNHGYDPKDNAAGVGANVVTSGRGATGTTDNKTRSKTRIAAARIGDMLFPTNSPNWALRPTPYPDVPIPLIMEEYKAEQAKLAASQPPPAEGAPPPQEAEMPMGQDALMAKQGEPGMEGAPPEGPPQPEQPPPPPQAEPDYELLANKVASKRCRKMTTRIRDVLAENDYPRNGRAAIMDGCKVGTGILKGPYVRFQTKRSYQNVEDEQGSIAELKIERVEVPGVARVSPWMWYPLRARCVEECEGSFELHILTGTQLRKYVKTHGFYPEAINRVLKTRPSLGSIEGVMAQRAIITNYSMSRYENSWACWEYEGIIDRDVLEKMGFELDEEDDLTAYYGAVWFIDNEIVRIDMAPLEAESALPYRVWNYEEDETNIFGFGVPFVMREDQYVIDMIWSAILHNVSVSAGPQIAIEKGVLIPADSSFHINGPKLWYKNDVDVPMKQAIDAVMIPSTVNSTMPVYQQALANADNNTNLPLMLGNAGPGSSQGQGLSGMAQITVMNQTNIVQRQAAHAWDDNITDPLITSLYHWFMQSDRPEDDAVKGDYQVEVRGASHLLVKDTQAQHAQLLLSMAGSDPALAELIHVDELYRVYLNFLDINVDALLKTPEQVEAEQAQQGPSPMEQAEMDKLAAEAKYFDARADTEMIRAQAEQQREMTIIDQSEIMALELKYAELQDKERDREHDMQKELVRRETKLIEIASKEGIAYEELNASISSDREQMMATLQNEDAQQRSRDYFEAAKLRLDQYNTTLKAQNLKKGFDTYG